MSPLSSGLKLMPERKCDFPIVAEMSQGKATCPDHSFKNFRQKGACQRCPKVNTRRRVDSDFLKPGERAAKKLAAHLRGKNNY